jgi:hypothetical protein
MRGRYPKFPSLVCIAPGNNGTHIIAPRDTRQRRGECPGNVLKIARIDGGRLHLHQHLT